jgi:hypothetical protein
MDNVPIGHHQYGRGNTQDGKQEKEEIHTLTPLSVQTGKRSNISTALLRMQRLSQVVQVSCVT